MPQDIKAFFHEWCAKNKFEPQFEVRPTGMSNGPEKNIDAMKNQ